MEFYDLAFRVRSPGDLSDDELDSTLDILQTRVVEQEKTQLRQVYQTQNQETHTKLNHPLPFSCKQFLTVYRLWHTIL